MITADLVSIVIAAYNAETYFAETISSVLVQTHAALELIVIDDGSTDGTANLARSTGDPRVRVESIPNSGRMIARNYGMALATGRSVAFLDADDLWDPTKLARQLPLLTGATTVVGCPFSYITPTGRRFGQTGEDPSRPGNRERVAAARLLPFPLSAALMDRAEVLAVGGMDVSLTHAEDLDIISKLAQRGDVVWVPEILGAYRIHPSSLSVANVVQQRQSARFLAERLATRKAGQPDPLIELSLAGPVTPEDTSASAFRMAALHIVGRQPLSALRQLTIAVWASPTYVVRRTWLKLRPAAMEVRPSADER